MSVSMVASSTYKSLASSSAYFAVSVRAVMRAIELPHASRKPLSEEELEKLAIV
jgi:hypothetical protein